MKFNFKLIVSQSHRGDICNELNFIESLLIFNLCDHCFGETMTVLIPDSVPVLFQTLRFFF